MADGTQNADTFSAPAGNSSFNGLGGVDTIVFNFALTSATIHWVGNQVIVDTPSSHTVLTGFEVFQFADGTVHNDDGNPLVDDLYYYWNNQDVWAAHVDADAHYNTLGWHEGRNPNAFFNTQLYLATNPDVAASGVNPLLHFDGAGWQEGRQPSLNFDTFAYLQNNPDVAAAHIDPLAHFLQFGQQEGRIPYDVTSSIVGPNGFDYNFYLTHNPDVAASGVDAYLHFLNFGWKEGRNPNAYFDTQGYLATYADVAAAGVNPFLHYITFGWKEGRDPSPGFDTSEYLLKNPDVAAAHVNPLEHFLQFGVHEGRVAFADSMFDQQGAASILPEGAANGTNAGIDSSWGGWTSPALSFSIISDTSGGGFAIDPVTGIVTVGDSTKLDFESSAPSHDYTIVVQAQDGGFTATQSYTIGITDVLPTTPVDSNAAADAVAEGAAIGTAVGVTLSSDEPNGPAVTYELTNTAGGRFAVDPSTGVVTVASGALLDFESSGPAHTFTITGRATIGAVVTATQNFTITVLDAPPSVPVDNNGAGNLVTEGAPIGTLVGITVSSTDPNGPFPTYSLTDSAGGRFQIDSLTGVVTIGPNANLIDFESSGGSYVITARATVGGLSSSQSFTINIGDVAPSQPTDDDGGTNTVAEGATTGAVVGVTASSTDVNGGTLTYNFAPGGDAGGRFLINTSTGVISVSALGASTIDYETSGPTHSYDVTVQATDGTLLSTAQTFTIAVTNVAPTTPVDNDGGAGGNILEGSATGTAVGITGFSTDPAGTALTYSLTGDTSGGGFQIDGTTGVVTVANSNLIDFETQPVGGYSITIQASDGQGGLSTQSFLVAVANAAPGNFTDTNGGVADSVTEGIASGQATGLTVNATDPAGTTVTYSLTDDAGGRFQINTSTGEVLTGPNANLIDFETSPGSYTITVQASDGAGGLGTTDFVIAVADAPPGNWSDLNAAANLVTEGDASNTLASLQADAIDPNGGTVTYSFADLAASAGGRFKIDSATGIISIDNAGLVDFESSGGVYNVIVTATTAGGTLTSTNGFTINVADLEPPQPADIDGTANAVTEGALAGTTVGIEADSLDVNGGNVAYTLTNSAGGLFAIDSVTGIVTVTAAGATGIDFESSGGSYVITVQASDGTLASTQSFTIAVGNAAPAQPTDADSNANAVSVNATAGTAVGVTLSSTDPNGGAVTYLLTDDEGGLFAVDLNTGVVTFAGGTLTAGTTYTLAGVALDSSLATSTAFSFDVFAANNQLNLDLNLDNSPAGANPGNSNSNTFTEQSAAVPISDTDTTITNTGNPGVTSATSATIVLTNAQIGDAFSFTGGPPAGITRTVVTGAGTITVNLTGTASYASYEAAIEQIQLSTTGDPTADAPNTTDRIIHVSVTDSTGTSPFATSTIHITPLNDAPVLLSNGSPATVSYTENALSTALLAGGTITDPDHPADFSGGTFTVAITANAAAGDQIVLLGGTDFAVASTTLLHNGTPIGTISGLGTNSVTVTGFTPDATPTVVNELAHAFGFQNSSDNPAAAPDRTVTFTFQDGGHTGGTAPGLSNVAVVTQNLQVIAVDDAPTAVADSATVSEDSGATAVNVLLNDTDPDGGSKTITLKTDGAHGTVTITGGGTGLTYQPAADYFGPDSFTYTLNGGSSTTVNVTVTEVNDSPTATDDLLSGINEDSGSRAITFTSLLANDSTGPANESGQALTITGTTNAVGGTITIIGTNIIFTPDTDFTGTASFDYTIQDNGTTNGAADFKTDTGHVSFAVTGVNDAPVNSVPFPETTVQNTPVIFDAAHANAISVSDVDTAGTNNTVTLSVTHGTLQIDETVPGGLVAADITGNGTASVTLTGSLTAINITLAGSAGHDGPTYTPTTGYTGPDTLTVLSTDAGNTGTGGALADTDTIDITVVPPIALDLDFDNSTALSTGYSALVTDATTPTPIAIVDTDVTITATVGSVSSATVLLTNANTGDSFTVDGSAAPTGTLIFGANSIDWSIDTSVANQVTITFSDNAGAPTTTDYEAALQEVAFNYTASPDTTDRNILVTAGTSPVATSTIYFHALDLNGTADAGTGFAAGTFTEGDLSGVAIADTDDAVTGFGAATLSATVTITNYVAGQDLLSFTDTALIEGSFVAGTLTLTAVAGQTPQQADYEAALQTVTYSNTSSDPNTTARDITVAITDGTSNTNIAHAIVQLSEVNNAPAATDDGLGAVAEDSGSRVIHFSDLTGNDTAVEAGQLLTITNVTNAVGGTVQIVGTDVIFTPTANFSGAASFDYTVEDDGTTNGVTDSQIDTGHVTFNITAVNDAPVVTPTTLAAVNEDATNPPGETLANLFIGHFTDIDAGSSLAGAAVSGNTANAGTQGTWQYSTDAGANWFAIGSVSDASALALSAASLVRFLPALNFNGTPPALSVYGLDNTFAGTFTVGATTSLIDASVNGGTTAISDNATTIGTSVTAQNDPPALTLDLNSSSPATGANFDVSYTVSGPAVAIADIDATITDVDDTNIESAVVTLTNPKSNDLLAVSGALPAGINAALSSGGGTITITLSGSASLAAYQAALQQVVFNNPLSFGTPDGDRTVTVTVFDGNDNSNTATTTIHVTQDSAPAGVDNTSGITAPSATVTGNATANDTDAQDPTSALVVSAVRTGAELGSGTSGTVGNALVGSYGALTLNFDGSYTYHLDNNNAAVQAAGSTDHLHDFFTYTVVDTAGRFDLAQIDIDITGVNDAPVANPDTPSATEAGGVGNLAPGFNPSGNVITDVGPGQDTDPDGDPLNVTAVNGSGANVGIGVTNASNFGTLTILGNGNYTYVVNNANTTVQDLRTSLQVLTDTFNYTISDGLLTSTAQVTVTIHGQNDNPVAGDDLGISATEAGGTNNGTAGVNPSGNVLTNDDDIDTVANGETETVQGVASGDQGITPISTGVGGAGIAGSFGTLTVNANGSFNYVVNNANTTVQGLNVGGTLTDTFTYTMRDTAGATDNALVTFTINGANDAPVAANDGSAATPAYIAFEGSALVVNAASGIRNNDSDVDNLTSSLTATKDTNPAHGTVTVNGDGSFTYTPTAGYLGGDSFTYHVNDPDPPGPSVSLASNSATVFIDVQPRVWHIDNTVTGDPIQDGSAAHPFQSIAAFNVANAAAAAADKPDIVYLHDGTGTYTTTDGVNLFNGQTFLGQGVDLTYTTSASAPGGPQLITLANLDNTQIPVIQVTGGAGNAGITLAQNNTLAGFTIETTNSAGIGIEDSNGAGAAGAVGTLNVSLVSITGIGQAIDIDQGGTLNATFNSITSGNSSGANAGSTAEGIQLGGIAGSLIGGSFTVTNATTIVNADTTAIQVLNTANNAAFDFGQTTVSDSNIGTGRNGNGIDFSTGLGTGNSFTFDDGNGGTTDLNVTTDAGFGLRAGAATVNISGTANSIVTNGGAAVELTNTSLGSGATFATVSSANSTGNGIQITGLSTGNFTANGGSITNATGTDVSITGGTANITYNGTITDDVGQLVSVASKTGGTVDFNGAITDGNDGDGSGISLTSNTGATVRFDGGLTLSTGANAAFTATGGGTVAVTNQIGGVNTIATTSGTALNVANTNIHADDLTFRSISAGTAAGSAGVGISLDTTGSAGGLHVTGTGTAGSGGTIQHKTGADGSTTGGIGIYLNSTSDVQFDRMQLNDFDNFAIRGNNVTGFTFDNSVISGANGNAAGAFDEAAISFNQLLGTASISNSNITNGFEYILKVLNSSGTLNRLTIDNTDFGTNSTTLGGDAVQIAASNTATANVTVTNSGFTNAREDLFNALATQTANMDVVFRDNTLSNNHTNKVSAASNILVFSTSTGTVTYDISHNTLTTGATGSAIAAAKGVPDAGSGGTMTGTINANTIGVAGVVGSGSQFTGIFASALGSGTHTTAITNNVIRHYNEEGIFLKANDNLTGGNSVLNATVTGNITTEPDSLAFAGLWVVAGSGSGTENNVVNVLLGSSSNASLQNDFTNGDPLNSTDVFLQESGSNSVINLSRAGSASGTAAGVVQDDNVGTPAVVASGTVNLVNTTPPLPPAVPPLLAAAGGVASASGASGDHDLTSPELAGIVAAAISHWADAGLADAQLASLGGLRFDIVDLGGSYLGLTRPGHVLIDDDAAGYGWFIDSTPFDDAEFGHALSATQLQTDPSGAPAGQMDLLTAVMHEIGHVLGLDHAADASGLMSAQLVTGERRLPGAADVAGETVAAPASGEVLRSHDIVGQNIAGGFDAQYYLAHNPDVAAAGVDPLQHFNTFGWHEGRNPNAYFDTAGYLAHYSDVAAAGVNPLQHYEQFGWHEGRDPSAGFDTIGYLAAYADVAAAGVNPLDHFLQYGVHEGRAAVNDGLWH